MLNIFKGFTYNRSLEQENLELKQQLKQQNKEIEELKAEIQRLKELLKLSNAREFGASSEKTRAPEITLIPLPENTFNEAEETADPTALEPDLETITGYTRKKKLNEIDN